MCLIKTMLFKIVLFSCFLAICHTAQEGDQCIRNGQIGICTVLLNCLAAVEDVRQRRKHTVCGYSGEVPIVCCLDYEVPPLPSLYRPSVATTRIPDRLTTTTEPPEIDYVELNEIPTGCAPVPADLTSTRTGQKAFDKCMEYQEQFVYPCEKGVTFTENMHRANHCHHDPAEVFSGAKTVVKNELPHLAMLGYGDDAKQLEWACGGTIISDRFILTAGHCARLPSEGNVTHVVVGVSSLKDTKNADNIYKVQRVIRHPDYKFPSKYHNLALVELEASIPLSQFVVPACLDVGAPVSDPSGLVISWSANKNSDNIRKVLLQRMKAQECSARFSPTRLANVGFDSQTQSCYTPTTPRQDPCQIDSGSAIIMRNSMVHCMYTAVGVTAYGTACSLLNEPSLYTRILLYVPWIESIVWP